MKILYCPCHYLYGETEGSEFSWSYNIGDRIATKHPDSIIITGKSNVRNKPYRIIELQPDKKTLDFSLKNAIRFNWLYYKANNRTIRQGEFDLIHHVLPFSIDRTFNLSLLLNQTGNLPFMIGPIQNSLRYRDTDINASDMRNYANKKNGSILNNASMALQPLLTLLSIKTLKKAKKITVINNLTKQLIVERGIPETKIAIIPPGVDTSRFNYIPLEQKSEIIELITVGYLIKRKGIELIIQAFAEVIKTHKGVRLRIIGDGPQRESLENLTKKLNLNDYVIFQRFIENRHIPEYYQKAHIFVNMSRSEGFATVCLEAMSSGLAIVSSRVGGFSDAINDGYNGFLINPEDYKMLAKKISLLIEDKELISKFSRRARQEARLKYDWDAVIVPKYIELYNSILKP